MGDPVHPRRETAALVETSEGFPKRGGHLGDEIFPVGCRATVRTGDLMQNLLVLPQQYQK